MQESDDERHDTLRRELEMPNRSFDTGLCPLPGIFFDTYERTADRRRSHGLPPRPRAERTAFGFWEAFAGGTRSAVTGMLRSVLAVLAARVEKRARSRS